MLPHQSISPLKTSGYRNHIQYGSLPQRAPPMPYSGAGPIGGKNDSLMMSTQELKQMVAPSKDPGRASGFNVKSPVLTNQGYQIAGMSSGTNPGLHSSTSPLKEYHHDPQARQGPGLPGGGAGHPDPQYMKLKYNDKNQISSTGYQQNPSPLTINPNQTPSKGQQSIGTIKETPEPLSAQSRKEKDLIKNAGHQAMFGSMYVTGSKN